MSNKVVDFRITIFNILCKTFKALKLFTVQKIVRKIQERKEKELSWEDLESDLAKIKQLKGNDARQLAYCIMIYRLNLDIQKNIEFFKKQVPQIETLNEEILDQDPFKLFLVTIENNKKYTLALLNVERILGYIIKKKTKTKNTRIKKQEKMKLKKETNPEEFKAQKPITKYQLKESQIQQNKQKQQVIKEKPREQIKQSEERVEVKQRTEFDFKKRRNEQKNRYSLKYDNQIKNQKQTQLKNSNANYQQEVHPSWQAKLDQEQIQPFQGKKIKLI